MYEHQCPEYYIFVMKARNLYFKGRKTTGYKIGVTECSPVARHWKRTNYFVESYMNAVTWGIVECLIKAKDKSENNIQIFVPPIAYNKVNKWLHLPNMFAIMYGIKFYIGLPEDGSNLHYKGAENVAREWDIPLAPPLPI
jgi:hypothetical protein